jgi:hypothetical protein
MEIEEILVLAGLGLGGLYLYSKNAASSASGAGDQAFDNWLSDIFKPNSNLSNLGKSSGSQNVSSTGTNQTSTNPTGVNDNSNTSDNGGGSSGEDLGGSDGLDDAGNDDSSDE